MAENDIQQIHELLIQLQDVLKGKFELEAEITALPADLNEQKANLAEANKAFLDIKDALDVATERFNKNIVDYEDAKAARAESEKRMELMTTQKEYEALQKEINDAKQKESGLLRARESSSKEVTELQAELDEQLKICDEIQAEVTKKSEEIDAIVEEKKAQVVELEAKCLEIKERGISEELYKKFSQIVKNKNGVGIVAVKNHVCQGCHMILPVQFVNDIHIGNTTEFCPYCSRILYYEESEGENEDYNLSAMHNEEEENDESLRDVASEDDDFDDILG